MDPLLTTWLDGADAAPTIDEGSVAVARESVRRAGVEVGLDAAVLASMAIVVSELAHNQLRHARQGWIAVRAIARNEARGIEIIAADRGSGIADIAAAIHGAPRPAGSLGVGLSSVLRQAPEIDVDDRLRQGLCVRARALVGPATPMRAVGVYARPCKGELASGDRAKFRRSGSAIELAVVDGLGHGPPAEDAADRAIRSFDAQRSLVPAREAIDAAARALERSRGAVMSVLRIDDDAAMFQHASVGNVTIRLERRGVSRSFVGSSATLGGRPAVSPVQETTPVARDEVLIAFTDGLRSRASLRDRPELLAEPPIVIAQRLAELFGRDDDDLLVLVAR